MVHSPAHFLQFKFRQPNQSIKYTHFILPTTDLRHKQKDWVPIQTYWNLGTDLYNSALWLNLLQLFLFTYVYWKKAHESGSFQLCTYIYLSFLSNLIYKKRDYPCPINIKTMSSKSSKMTLHQYIEGRNYRKRIQSKSKSQIKLNLEDTVPQQPESLCPWITGESQEIKTQQMPQIKQIIRELKDIDQNIQGFSRIHKKTQQIKEFVRQFIRDDKIFVSFCQNIVELQSILRLQLIEAYRFQLFKFQSSKQKTLDQNKVNMLRQINQNYMKSRFQYKKSLSKTKTELTKCQKLIIQDILQQKYLLNHTQQKKSPSFQSASFASLNSKSLVDQTGKGNQLSQGCVSSAQYAIKKTKSQTHQTNGIQNRDFVKLPSSKKVVFLNQDIIFQSQVQSVINSDFVQKRKSRKSNSQKQLKQPDQLNTSIFKSNMLSSERQLENMCGIKIIKSSQVVNKTVSKQHKHPISLKDIEKQQSRRREYTNLKIM